MKFIALYLLSVAMLSCNSKIAPKPVEQTLESYLRDLNYNIIIQRKIDNDDYLKIKDNYPYKENDAALLFETTITIMNHDGGISVGDFVSVDAYWDNNRTFLLWHEPHAGAYLLDVKKKTTVHIRD